ncbi:MAG: hypothetical protein NTV33_13900 [Coprothermobacterota bacterium]|nr:hypothetical protein [Coprothermobacterota bacterium]
MILFLSLCVLTFSLGILPPIAKDGATTDVNASTPPPESVLHQFHLGAGWNLISLPFVTDPSPLVVFAELPTPWFLAEYDAVENAYHPYTQVSLRPGVGYWLRVPEAVNFTLQGTAITVRNTCALLKGWNLVGYPFPWEISWDDAARVRVERGGQFYSLQQAFDAGILAGDIYSWREGRYFSVKNELRQFTPGYGYWVKLNGFSTMDGIAPGSANLVFEPGGSDSEIASKDLQVAYTGVKRGAASWAAKTACGWVMSLLTGNKGQGAAVLERLDQMEAQLQDIQASLERIEANFTQLFAQLKQMQAKIIDTILNAQVKDYINRIDTHYNTVAPEGLVYYTQGKTPTTPGIQEKVAQFCANVTGPWDIPNCINGIHLAIAPKDGSDGLLDSWLSANILTNTATWTFQPQRLMDYYLAYESYFAGMLFYEYRGIQIYTEVLNQRDPTGQDAKGYLDQSYTPNLSAEVDRFLIGAARLVAYSATPTTNPRVPLFQGGQDVLSRAQFFAIQARDEPTFGIRATLLTTADALKPTGNLTPLVSLKNSTKASSFYWNPSSSGLQGSTVNALTIDPRNSQTLYASTRGYGLFKSTNGGTSWNASSSGLTSYNVNSVLIDTSPLNALYAGTDGGGICKSTDGGASWNASSSGMTNSDALCLVFGSTPQTLYAGTRGSAVFRSTDGGANWEPWSNGLTRNVVLCLASYIPPHHGGEVGDPTLYAGTLYGGIFKSTNGGRNWSEVNNGLTGTLIADIAIDPSNSQILYAATDAGVFKSTNGGGNWSSVNNGITSFPINSIAIDSSNNQILYAGTKYGGVFRSINGGNNWETMNQGLDGYALQIGKLAIDPSSPRILYAGAEGGIFKASEEKKVHATILRVPKGPAYRLEDGASSLNLGTSTDWLLLQANFGEASLQDLGNGWTVQLVDNALPAPPSPAFPVSAYDDGYHLVTTGTILYGLGFGWAGGPH